MNLPSEESPLTKKCSHCKKELYLHRFSINSSGRYGIHSVCKPCQAKEKREGGALNRQRISILVPNHKICPKCNRDLDKECFNTSLSLKDGLSSCCKQCSNSAQAKRKIVMSSRIKIDTPLQKACVSCNKTKDIENFYVDLAHPDGRYYSCKTCWGMKSSLWDKNNRERIVKTRKERYAKDVQFKMSCVARVRIYEACKGMYKSGSGWRDLGCDWDTYKRHLSSLFWPGMTWNNYGRGGWTVDHIIPLKRFDLSNRERFLLAVNYKNLQPLWPDDNAIKRDRLDWSPSESHHELPERLKNLTFSKSIAQSQV